MATLVTGGTGFIGREIVRMLVARGEHTVVFHRSKGAARWLDDIADQVTLIQGDLAEFSHVLHAVKQARPKTIYHMGAMLSIPSENDPASAIQTNAMGTFYVLEAARLFDVEQVIFASSIGTYGADIQTETIDDFTLQRPSLIYGATKAFGEHLGFSYKRKYGLDFRGIRYASVIGAGVETPGLIQFTSWVIESCAMGKPFTFPVEPDTRIDLMYIKDAARAALELAEAPPGNIRMGMYLLCGIRPTPTMGELAEAVRHVIPDAQINFEPNPALQATLQRVLRPIDDTAAQREWGWGGSYSLGQAVEAFVRELRDHPQLYG